MFRQFALAVSNTGRHVTTRRDTMRLGTKWVLVPETDSPPLFSGGILTLIWLANLGVGELTTRSNTLRLSRLDFASEVLINDLERPVAGELVTQFLRASPE